MYFSVEKLSLLIFRISLLYNHHFPNTQSDYYDLQATETRSTPFLCSPFYDTYLSILIALIPLMFLTKTILNI